MKRIIYTAAALIICASVFGIADYFNARKEGTLVNYSDDAQTTEAVIPEKQKEIPTAITQEKLLPVTKKQLKKGGKSEKKMVAKVKDTHLTDKISNLAVTGETKYFISENPGTADVVQSKATDEKKTDSTLELTVKRKISMEMFSRAPIREKKFKKK